MKGTDFALVIPPPRHGRDKYGLRQLKVLGSKFYPAEPGRPTEVIRCAVRMHGKRNGVRFVCRSVVESGVAGVRIWRTA